MLVRILYLNVVSKLIFLTIVLLNNLTKKIKISKSIIQDSVELEWLKLIYQSVSLVIFQVICGLITVMNNVNVHIFNTFSVLFYSKHAHVNRTKKNQLYHMCILSCTQWTHSDSEGISKCNDILKPPPFDASSTL